MAFSRAQSLIDARDMKIRQAIQKARKSDQEFKILHNDEVKDAQNKNYTKLIARINKEHTDYVTKAKNRRIKILS